MLRSTERATQENGFAEFLRLAPVVALDETTMQVFARERTRLRTARALIGDLDLLIAATALHHDLTLVTRNLRHFARIPELKLHPGPS